MMRNQLVETEETDSYIGVAGSLDASTVARGSKGKAAKRNTAAEQQLGAGSRAAAEQQQSSGETVDIGVQSRDSEIVMRGERGKFAPGHPPTPGGGRPPVDKTPDIRAAIWKRYTLEEIFGRLDTAYRIAVEMKSSRGIVASLSPEELAEYKKQQRHWNKIRTYQERGATGKHTLKQWEALKAKCGYKCQHCGKKEPQVKLTRDHIVPISRGGSNDISNIQPLCKKCNSSKHNKLESELSYR